MKINKIKKLLDPIEGLVFRNADDFCKKFCKINDVMDLVSVRFSSCSVEFVYVSDSGQHFVDGIDWDEFEPWLKEMEVKEEIKQWIVDYINAKHDHSIETDKKMDAMQVLASGGTDFEPITMPYYRFIEDTFARVLGKDNHEWVEWYLYDNMYREHRLGGKVVIDGCEYDITTPEQLVEICMNINEVNLAFFGDAE